MATTADLIARLRDIMGEEAADFYTDATEMLPALNEGKNRLFSDGFAIPKALTPIASVDGQADYNSPTDLVRWNRLLYLGEELHPISAYEYGGMDTDVMDVEGTPFYYVHDLISATGAPQFRLCPKPAASVAGAITGMYWARPADLTTGVGGVNPTWHPDFHFVPCYWAASVMLLKDHRPEAAQDMAARFEIERKRYRDAMARQRPPRSNAGLTDSSALTIGRLPAGYPDLKLR